MSKKLTPWFPPEVKPVHIGVYETAEPNLDSECFQHWNGSFWGLCSSSARYAATNGQANGFSGFQQTMWRGLAKKP